MHSTYVVVTKAHVIPGIFNNIYLEPGEVFEVWRMSKIGRHLTGSSRLTGLKITAAEYRWLKRHGILAVQSRR